MGFAAMAMDLESRLAAADIGEGDFPRKENFWRGPVRLPGGPRTGKTLRRVGARWPPRLTTGPKRQGSLAWPRRGAGLRPGRRNFFEAVQSLWLAHILTAGEDCINANSIGRLDQILWPYYQADRDAGGITRRQAVELMEELACKLYLDYEVQAITLAGLKPDGSQAANELTDIILDATGNVGFVRDLSVRLSPQSDPKLVRRCAELVVKGGESHSSSTTTASSPALAQRGIDLEDARNYSPIGCIELTIPGKANPHAVSGWFSAAGCLELALFNGQDPRTGEQVGPATGRFEDFASVADLHRAIERQMAHFAPRDGLRHQSRRTAAARARRAALLVAADG